MRLHDGKPHYCWLPLQKRTEKDTVSGEVHLRMQWSSEDLDNPVDAVLNLTVDLALHGIGLSVVESSVKALPREVKRSLVSFCSPSAFRHVSTSLQLSCLYTNLAWSMLNCKPFLTHCVTCFRCSMHCLRTSTWTTSTLQPTSLLALLSSQCRLTTSCCHPLTQWCCATAAQVCLNSLSASSPAARHFILQ